MIRVMLSVLFVAMFACVAAGQETLVHVEFAESEGGHVKYLKGDKEIGVKAIGMVGMTRGNGKVHSASHSQTNIEGSFTGLIIAHRLMDTPNRVNIALKKKTQVKVTLGEGNQAGIVYDQVHEAGTFTISW